VLAAEMVESPLSLLCFARWRRASAKAATSSEVRVMAVGLRRSMVVRLCSSLFFDFFLFFPEGFFGGIFRGLGVRLSGFVFVVEWRGGI
jgi:hypothetical protein